MNLLQYILQAADQMGRLDVIVLDWVMPGMHGAEVLAELKKNPATSSIPVIMMSGIEKEGAVSAASGATMFLDKNDLNVSALAFHVAALCAQSETVQ